MASIANARSIAKSAGFLEKTSMSAMPKQERRLHTLFQPRLPQYLRGGPAGTVQSPAGHYKLQSEEKVVSVFSLETILILTYMQ